MIMEGQPKQPTPSTQPPNPNNTYTIQTYTNPKQIRYLQDFLLSTPHPNYKKLDLEAFDSNTTQINQYDSIYEKLYKKVARDGYLQKTKQITKKSKKGGDENFYNSLDPFIDDGFAGQEKDVKESTFSDFKAVQGTLAEFYRSLDYRPEVVLEAKRKPEKMEIPEEEREKIIRKVKNKQRDEEGKKLEQ